MPIPKLIVQPTNLYQVNISKHVEPDLSFISNTTFCAVLQQISSLSDLANNIFDDLTKELSSITERSMRLSKRMKAISEDFSQLKKGEEDLNSSSVVNDGQPFVSKKPADSQVLNKNTIPLPMRMYYENAEVPPNVQIMDRLRDDGKISMKMYSDPSFFFDLWSQEMLQASRIKGKKKKKIKNVAKQGIKMNGNQSGYIQKEFLIEQTGLGSGIIQPKPVPMQPNNMNNGISIRQSDQIQINQYPNHVQVSQNSNYKGVMNNHHNQMIQNSSYQVNNNIMKNAPLNPYQSMKMPANLMPSNLIKDINQYQSNNQSQKMSNTNQEVDRNQGNQARGVCGDELNKGIINIHLNDLPPPPPAPLLHQTPFQSGVVTYVKPESQPMKVLKVENKASPSPPPPPPPQIPSAQLSQESNSYPTPPPPPPVSSQSVENNNNEEESSRREVSRPPAPPPPPPPPSTNTTKPIIKKSSNNESKTKLISPKAGPPQDLLSAIRAGCTLRKVSQEHTISNANSGFMTLSRHTDVQSIYDAVIRRRQMMESETDKESHESSDDNWED